MFLNMPDRTDHIWKSESLAATYLEGVRAAIPLALESLDHEMFIDSLHRHHPTQTREEVARLYYDRPDKDANILAPVEEQCAWLRGIGFTDVDCYLKVFELAVFGGRRP